MLLFVHADSPTGPVVANESVKFLVTSGPSAGTRGEATTNADGLATFTYSTAPIAPAGGTDKLTAWLDLDGNGVADASEPQAETQLLTLPTQNLAPVATDIFTTVAGGVTTPIELTGTDPDGTFVSFTIENRPVNGTLPEFLISPFVGYTPNAGFTGNDSFTYRVTDANGESDTATVAITVTPAVVSELTAAFSMTPSNGNAPLVVTVANETTPAGATTVSSVVWDFGDGSPAVAADSGSHVYSTPGQFTIKMTVTDSAGRDSVATKTVEVVQVPGGTQCEGRDATITGAPGQEAILGTDGPDVIVGGAAPERIYGFGGDDIICAGASDIVYAGDGNDTIVIDGDSAIVHGEEGNDVIRAPGVEHQIRGGAGNDTVTAGPRSLVWGADGDDFLVVNGAGNVFGGNGNDVIEVGPHAVALGGSGDDHITSGQGSSVLGGSGNNTLRTAFSRD